MAPLILLPLKYHETARQVAERVLRATDTRYPKMSQTNAEQRGATVPCSLNVEEDVYQ